MSPNLESKYQLAAQEFWKGGGAIGEVESRMRSWRYFLEINSACNLSCPTCTKGNKEGYDHQTGIMDWQLMLDCIDKIYSENSEAIVLLYGNSEPFIHPRLHECVKAVTSKGLRCHLSTNCNYVHHAQEVIDALPELFIISLSGFTQEVYVKGHAGGNIEKVKANMKVLAEANNPHRITLAVSYHLYKDNEHEIELMRNYAESLGINFFVVNARAISMENAIQYCRSKDKESTPFAVQANQPDWNHLLPKISQQWIETMDRIHIPPDQAVEMYSDYPRHGVCPVGAGGMFTFIRHDGKAQMCACTADRRITLGNYLDMSPDEMIQKRTGHSICRQCMKYRLNLYFHVADSDKWKPEIGLDIAPVKA